MKLKRTILASLSFISIASPATADDSVQRASAASVGASLLSARWSPGARSRPSQGLPVMPRADQLVGQSVLTLVSLNAFGRGHERK